MKRRDVLSLLGGTAVWWPLGARAQPERMRRIGVLMNTIPNSDQKASIDVFRQALQQLGWTEGRNVQIDIRWAGGDPARDSQACRRLARPIARRGGRNRQCGYAADFAGDGHRANSLQQHRGSRRRRFR
jgi:hypothetical protein